MSVTIESVQLSASEMLYGGQVKSVKLALMVSAMSKSQSVSANGRQARILARYTNSALPTNKEELFQELRPAKGAIFWSHIETLYYIDALWAEGLLDGLEEIGYTRDEQLDWRFRLKSLLNGHGMSWKTISMAAFILSPLNCELVPIDRWAMRYLGLPGDSSPQRYDRYAEIENRIAVLRNASGYANVPLVLYHWLLWETARQDAMRSKEVNGIVESHKNLSCRWY